MARAQAHYLRIVSNGVTLHRWQSFYVNQSVTWNSATWQFRPFETSGITSGQNGEEAGVTVSMPALPDMMAALQDAIELAATVELSIYQFDPAVNDTTPQGGQVLLATFVGEVVRASATLTQFVVELGSALSPVGAQIPPRTMTTRLIGQGCRL